VTDASIIGLKKTAEVHRTAYREQFKEYSRRIQNFGKLFEDCLVGPEALGPGPKRRGDQWCRGFSNRDHLKVPLV
jgi:hypothetical protein